MNKGKILFTDDNALDKDVPPKRRRIIVMVELDDNSIGVNKVYGRNLKKSEYRIPLKSNSTLTKPSDLDAKTYFIDPYTGKKFTIGHPAFKDSTVRISKPEYKRLIKELKQLRTKRNKKKGLKSPGR